MIVKAGGKRGYHWASKDCVTITAMANSKVRDVHRIPHTNRSTNEIHKISTYLSFLSELSHYTLSTVKMYKKNYSFNIVYNPHKIVVVSFSPHTFQLRI